MPPPRSDCVKAISSRFDDQHTPLFSVSHAAITSSRLARSSSLFPASNAIAGYRFTAPHCLSLAFLCLFYAPALARN
ncbi:hypothetical protein KCP78_06080 [Salmonella enterica subsp. enterica]|nr:hypothetical protein KCP78_06080 [Salmonella enterica subsp. enterica]